MRKEEAEDRQSEGYPDNNQRLDAIDPRIVALEELGISEVNRLDLGIAGHLDFEELCAEHSDTEGVFTTRELIESHARLEKTLYNCQAAFDLIMAASSFMERAEDDPFVPSVFSAISGYAAYMAMCVDMNRDMSMCFADGYEPDIGTAGEVFKEETGLAEGDGGGERR
ncbi:MAG: hypothetical protein ACI36Y_01885 [Coriobacteriales bacterium]